MQAFPYVIEEDLLATKWCDVLLILVALVQHRDSLCKPTWSTGTFDQVIAQNVDALGDVAEGLESKWKEPSTSVATVAARSENKI